MKLKRNFRSYIYEFFTVLLGVFMAFLMNEWRDSSKTQNDVEIAMVRVNREIILNYRACSSFQKKVEKKVKLLDELEDHVKFDQSFSSYSDDFGGYQLVGLRSAAWNRVRNSYLVNLLPVDYLEDVYGIYHANEMMVEYNQELYRIILDQSNFDASKSKLVYAIAKNFVNQQNDWGKGIKGIYDEFFEGRPSLLAELEKDSVAWNYHQQYLAKLAEEKSSVPDSLKLSQKR